MATETIGSLVAIVSATAAKFSSDMDKITNRLTAFQSSAESAGAGVTKALDIGVAVAGVEAAFEVAKSAAESFFAVFEKAHQLERLAEEVNSTAGELSGLQFAAMEVGQSAESFDMALGKMTQKIGEAREGSEKTSVAFEALGLNVNKLAGMTAGGALESIANAMQRVPNAADRAAIAVELFGKAGREMLPLLEQGRAGIEAFIQKGQEMGAVMGTEQAAQLAEAQRNLNELKAAWQGLVTTLATAVLPILNKVIESFDWIIRKERDAVSAIKGGIALLTGNAETGTALGEQRRAEGEAIKRRQAEEAKENIIAQLKERNEWFKKYREEQARNEEEANRMSIAHAKKLVEETRHIAEEHARHAKQIADASRTPMEKFKDTIADLRQYLEMGAISFRVFEEAAGKAMDEMEKASFKHKDVSESMRSGISGADITSSSGASLAISAQRAAQDIGLHSQDIEEDQLAEQRLHTNLLQQILQAAGGRKVDLAVLEP